jgi:seryl-tRNA synthetase
MNHEEVGAEELNDYMDSLEKEIIQLEQENRELKAQVEQLRDAGNDVYAELQQWALQSSHKETDAVFKAWRKAREATPAQCLAEIKAQAGRDAVVSALRLYGEPSMTVSEIDSLADRYANQLRHQVNKAGE